MMTNLRRKMFASIFMLDHMYFCSLTKNQTALACICLDMPEKTERIWVTKQSCKVESLT